VRIAKEVGQWMPAEETIRTELRISYTRPANSGNSFRK
jgi:hypothetical protein